MHETHQQNHGTIRLRSQKTKHIAQRDFSVEMASTSRESRVATARARDNSTPPPEKQARNQKSTEGGGQTSYV
jgi:hypothetical protein